jgi:phospholipid/cholesterol/gamma-HCH transport system substrate-binding protein
METKSDKFKVRLGLFVAGGLALFVLAIFFIGKQKNLFNPVFKITTYYKSVSGLLVGNNIRFSGINVGTVDNIEIVNDTTVKVDMLIQKEVQKFIKADCKVGIGSEGIIGDRILVISQGNPGSQTVKENQVLGSVEPVETDAIMGSLKVSGENAEIVTGQLAEILYKINNGSGTLGRLIQDTAFAENIDQTLENLKKSSKGLNENMEAAKHNFLLKGYFKKKEKDAEKLKKEAEEKKKDEQEEKDKQKEK